MFNAPWFLSPRLGRSVAVLSLVILAGWGTARAADPMPSSAVPAQAPAPTEEPNAQPGSERPAEVKTLKRVEEPLIVSGSVLPQLSGCDVRRLGLFALRDGKMTPIPFQVDEKTSKGDWALGFGPQTVLDDDDPEVAPAGCAGGEGDPLQDAPRGKKSKGRKPSAILDKSDEVVLMTGDTGDRAPKSIWPEGWKLGAEIRAVDPTDGGTGWAYLLGFDSGPAARSTKKYVRYDLDAQRVYTQDFALGFSKTIPVTWDHLTISAGKEGEYLENRLDRLKIRGGATMLFGGIEVLRNEEDFESEIHGWNEGAIRIVRQVENSVNVIFGLQSPSSLFESHYYRNCINVPTTIKLPFKMGLFFTDMILKAGVDFRDLKGWKAITSRNPKPVDIDGKMSDEEKAWDLGDTDWVVFYKENLAFMSTLILGEELKGKIQRNIYYMDDEKAPDPPEFFVGQVPELLYDMRGWNDVGAGSYRFQTVNYAIRDYHPGDELFYMDIISKPCRVTVEKGLD